MTNHSKSGIIYTTKGKADNPRNRGRETKMKRYNLCTIVNFMERLQNHGYAIVRDGHIKPEQVDHRESYGLNLVVEVPDEVRVLNGEFGDILVTADKDLWAGEYNLKDGIAPLSYSEANKALVVGTQCVKGIKIISKEEV